MPRTKDLAGKKINKLTVIRRTTLTSTNRCSIWECSCDCGKTHYLPTDILMQGKQKSCGCANKDRPPRKITHGHCAKGMSTTYRAWSGMKNRCLSKNNPKFPIYGGRGISICESWLDFSNFLQDMGAKPEGMTLERKNVNGNYEKSNCVWASPKVQANNKRNNRRITHNNLTMTVSQWADHLHMPFTALRMRLHRGWSIKDALNGK